MGVRAIAPPPLSPAIARAELGFWSHLSITVETCPLHYVRDMSHRATACFRSGQVGSVIASGIALAVPASLHTKQSLRRSPVIVAADLGFWSHSIREAIAVPARTIADCRRVNYVSLGQEQAVAIRAEADPRQAVAEAIASAQS